MKKGILYFLLCFIMITSITAQKAEDSALIKEQEVPEAPLLDWPLDKPKGLSNYAQELVFNRKKASEYLHIAWAYYMNGYNGMKTYMGDDKFDSFKQITGIKRYEYNGEAYDLYERHAYKVEIFSYTGPSLLRDFIEAEWYFTKALDILKNKVAFDPQVTSKQLYKDLIKNLYRSKVYCSLYIGNYKKALNFLNEYKKYSTDTIFITEWETRIYGVLVEIAKKYDWVFVGDKSYGSMKRQHREKLLKAIDLHYPADSVLKEELKKRIYPELIPEKQKITSNTNIK